MAGASRQDVIKTLQSAAPDLAREALGLEVRDVSQIAGRGSVNHVFVLTAPEQTVVLRIDAEEAVLDRFEREAWAMTQARAVGVPVPEVLALGLHDGRPYMVSTFIEGTDGDHCAPSQQADIYRSLGVYAGCLRKIAVTGFNEQLVSPGVFADSWSRYLTYNLDSLGDGDELAARGILGAEDSTLLRRVFLELQDRPFDFGLIHGDLALRNTIRTSDGAVHLLDWGCVEAHVVPHAELRAAIGSGLKVRSAGFDQFLEGYGLTRTDYEALRPDMARLDLLVRTDKVRWALARKPERLDDLATALRSALDRKPA